MKLFKNWGVKKNTSPLEKAKNDLKKDHIADLKEHKNKFNETAAILKNYGFDGVKQLKESITFLNEMLDQLTKKERGTYVHRNK